MAALLVVLALAGVVGAQDSSDDDALDPDAYESMLAPHGGWYDVPSYGRVWRPTVVTGWAPYTDGQWVWTAYGWTWVSFEPWAWTFHYGRWALAPSWGWVWVPGTVWGPAWVDWVYYDGYVGWAPLAPFGWRAGFDDYWFVRDDQFCNPRLRSAYVRRGDLPRNVHDHWNEHRVDRLDRHRIERVTRYPVQRYDQRPTATLAPWHRARVEPIDRSGDRDRGGRPGGWGGGDRRTPRPGDDRRRYDGDVPATRRPVPSAGPGIRQPEPPLPPPVVRERRNDPGTVTRSAPNAPSQRPSAAGAWRGDVRPMDRPTAPRGGGDGGAPRSGSAGNRGGEGRNGGASGGGGSGRTGYSTGARP